MATELEVADAKTRFPELLDRARNGEEIVLVEQGKRVVRLVPEPENPRERALGYFRGKIWMSDDFDAPLTDEELKEWGL